jgi:C-terminal processing protease CtpA/Prc
MEWCRVSQSDGEAGKTPAIVKVEFLENSAVPVAVRTTTLIITAGNVTKEVIIEQLDTEIIVPGKNPEYEVNEYIYENIIREWYYWDKEAGESEADYNQSYLSLFNSQLNYLNKFVIYDALDGNAWAVNNEPYLYSYIKRIPKAEANLTPLSYGMEFDLQSYRIENNSGAKMVARVLYVLNDSPAKAAGLKRGDWFYKINDVAMGDWVEDRTREEQYKRLIDTLVRPIEGEKPKLGMLRFEAYSNKVFDNGESVTVSSARFHGNPIIYSQIIPRTVRGVDTRTGYLVYNSFDPKFKNELDEEFRKFKEYDNPNDGLGTPGITHLVLDLRYNKTGTVEMAEHLANLIVPSSMNGQTFAHYEFNEQHTELNHTALLLADPNSVGLTTVYILTSANTAGAAELLINAFKGLEDVGMTLVVIGDTTEGMNTGMVKRIYDTDNYRYELRLVAFRCYNAAEEGDYHWGLSPSITVNEWEGDNKQWRGNGAWGWVGTTGAAEDPLLFEAMNYIIGSATMSGSVTYGTQRERQGFERMFSVQSEMIMESASE